MNELAGEENQNDHDDAVILTSDDGVLPPAPVAEGPPKVLYVVDSSRASFAELWRDTRSWTVIIAWLFKLFRARIPGSVNDPNVETLAPFEVDFVTLSEEVRAAVEPRLREMYVLGFDVAVAHEIIDLFNHSRSRVVTMSRGDGSAVGRVWYRTEGAGNPPKTHYYVDFVTALADGSSVWSTSARSTMSTPREVYLVSGVGASAEELWQLHQAEVQRRATSQEPALSRVDVLALIERHHQKLRDYHLARKVFRPMRDLDRQTAAELEARINTAVAQGVAYPEVWAELVRLQQKRRGWGGAALLLIVSLGLFVAAGAARWEWKYVGLLVALLFFHEFGHFIAMKVFRYRNLRMFFIPLMGAAVSGVNYSAPGWKKVIVALMGPLPGILLGIAVGIGGMVTGSALALEAAILALILNGLNLLPVLPLDGGRVVHTLFFARHWVLDVLFRCVAALALIAGSYAIGDRLLMFLGIFMLIGIPTAYKLARVSADLRRQGLRPAMPDEQMIPPDVAEQIITRIRAAFPKAMGHKVTAQHTLSVYETVNTRTPGWLATSAFTFMHIGAVVVAVVMLSMCVVVQHRGIDGLWNGNTLARAMREGRAARDRELKYVLDVTNIRNVDRAAPDITATPPTTAPTTIVGTFDAPAKAAEAFDTLRARAPAALFGQTVLLPVASDRASREQWLSEMETRTGDAFVVTTRTGGPLALDCIAPNAGMRTELAEEAKEYFSVPSELHLIPPWSPAYDPNWRRARSTFIRLQQAPNDVYNVAEMKQFSARFRELQRRGDVEGVEQIEKERAAAHQRARDTARRQVLASRDIDIDLARAYIRLTERYDHEAAATASIDDEEGPHDGRLYEKLLEAYSHEFGERMGQVELAADGRPVAGALRYSTRGGVAIPPNEGGGAVQFRWVAFIEPAEGAPALARWLAGKSCTTFRYEFNFGPRGVGDYFDDLSD